MGKSSEKKPKKRTGKIGPIISTTTGVEFQPIKFPNDKEEIERFIVSRLITGLNSKGHNFYNLIGYPLQNEQDDYDFTLLTKSGIAHLELMEVAIFENVKGSYDAAPMSYHCGDMADNVYAKVMKKSNKYETSSHIHLLLYTTDFRFRLSKCVTSLLGYWFLKQKHVFRTILYFIPDDNKNAELITLYPVPPENYARFDERAARNKTILIGDMTKVIRIDENTFEIPLGPPPKTFKK